MRVTPIFSPEDQDLTELAWNMATDENGRHPKHSYTNPNPPPRQKITFAHIVVIERVLGRKRCVGELTDHINGNVLDCRRENLRITDHVGNSQNRRCGKYRGVTRHKQTGKWQAQVYSKGKNAYIGLFNSPYEAWNAAASRRKELGFLEGVK